MDLGERRSSYVRSLDRALEEITDLLAGKEEVERVIVFGSYAEGRKDLFTDLDLLVVMSSELDFFNRTGTLYREISVGVDLDLLVYTPEEFESLKDHGIVRRALETGRVLYEKKSSR